MSSKAAQLQDYNVISKCVWVSVTAGVCPTRTASFMSKNSCQLVVGYSYLQGRDSLLSDGNSNCSV